MKQIKPNLISLLCIMICIVFFTCEKYSEEIVIITPYLNDQNVEEINPFFTNINENLGICFLDNSSSIQAAAHGKVLRKVKWEIEPGIWKVELEIEYNKTYSYTYEFEDLSVNDATTQFSQLSVDKNDKIKQGEIIGTIFKGSKQKNWMIFVLYKNSKSICPDPYFATEAEESILNIIHHTRPYLNICNDELLPLANLDSICGTIEWSNDMECTINDLNQVSLQTSTIYFVANMKDFIVTGNGQYNVSLQQTKEYYVGIFSGQADLSLSGIVTIENGTEPWIEATIIMENAWMVGTQTFENPEEGIKTFDYEYEEEGDDYESKLKLEDGYITNNSWPTQFCNVNLEYKVHIISIQ